MNKFSTTLAHVVTILWLLVVVASMLSYPKPDNLVVAYPIYIIGGLHALEWLYYHPIFFVGLIIVEAVFIWGVIFGVASFLHRKWGYQDSHH